MEENQLKGEKADRKLLMSSYELIIDVILTEIEIATP